MKNSKFIILSGHGIFLLLYLWYGWLFKFHYIYLFVGRHCRQRFISQYIRHRRWPRQLVCILRHRAWGILGKDVGVAWYNPDKLVGCHRIVSHNQMIWLDSNFIVSFKYLLSVSGIIYYNTLVFDIILLVWLTWVRPFFGWNNMHMT